METSCVSSVVPPPPTHTLYNKLRGGRHADKEHGQLFTKSCCNPLHCMYYTSYGQQHAMQARAATLPLLESKTLPAIHHIKRTHLAVTWARQRMHRQEQIHWQRHTYTHANSTQKLSTDTDMMYGCCQFHQSGHTGINGRRHLRTRHLRQPSSSQLTEVYRHWTAVWGFVFTDNLTCV